MAVSIKQEITGPFAPYLSELDALAMTSEHFRPIVATLLKTPGYRRARVFTAWLKKQPNAAEIIEAISKVDVNGPPPGVPLDPAVN